MNLFGGEYADSPLTRLPAAGITGYASVSIAAYVAPIAWKAVPAIVMAAIIFMLCGLAILLNMSEGFWLSAVEGVVGAIAAGVAMYQQIEETRHLRSEM